MVRVNIVEPRRLTDQHLIAEYNEILMLLGYVRKYPALRDIPLKYSLGKGHILFFKNKLRYLKERHELIKLEMRKRGFETNKTINLKEFSKELCNNWIVSDSDRKIILARIAHKIRSKPKYYRYYGKKQSIKFLLDLLG